MIPNRVTGPGDSLKVRLAFILVGGVRDGLIIVGLMALLRACVG